MANIYFNALDQWIEQHVVPHFSVKTQNRKVITDQYLTAVWRWNCNPWEKVLELTKALTPSINMEKLREMLKSEYCKRNRIIYMRWKKVTQHYATLGMPMTFFLVTEVQSSGQANSVHSYVFHRKRFANAS